MTGAPYTVEIGPAAEQTLGEIVSYITAQDGPGRAGDWLRGFLGQIEVLERRPKSRQVWTRRKGEPIHALLASPYRVFYVVDDAARKVYIIDIIHTARGRALEAYAPVEER